MIDLLQTQIIQQGLIPQPLFINEYAYFNASTGKITYFTDFTYSDDEIKKINELIYAKMNMSSKAIKNNYFAYLFEKIENEKENVK